MHRTRETVEQIIRDIDNGEQNSTDSIRQLLEINIELLLDIRDVLYDINKSQGVPRWGPKIKS